MTEKKSVRPNIFQRAWGKIRDLLRETIGELRKVHWPTRREALRLTQVVVLVILVMTLILGGLDWIYTRFFGLIIGG